MKTTKNLVLACLAVMALTAPTFTSTARADVIKTTTRPSDGGCIPNPLADLLKKILGGVRF
jgi:hypothetical protein